ncbi:MAG: hypothetical protein AAF799_21155 [Myxococcota bacterium]
MGAAACIAPVTIGGNPVDSDSDSDSGVDTDDPVLTTGEPPAETEDVPANACPDSPEDYACTVPTTCNGFCGGMGSEYDADGCLRSRCSIDDDCADGRTCVRLGDWGGGAPSSTFCEMSEGECVCGGTADGNVDIRVCIPDEEIPEFDPAVCSELGSGASFSWVVGEVTAGESTCTVLAVGDMLDMACTGAIEGDVTLALAAGIDLFAVDDVIALDYRVDTPGKWTDQWVKLQVDGKIGAQVVAAQTSNLAPSGESAGWLTDGSYELSLAEATCPYTACDGVISDFGLRPIALRAGQGENFEDFWPGEAGPVPGKFGGVSPDISVLEMREGSCFLDQPPQWLSFVIVREGF